ncbi:hypothetical protein OROMI_005262 [Orobanche minor]
MKRPPYFDARAVCYPSRRMKGHINNQHNTCSSMLEKSGISEPHKYLKGTRTREKNQLLDQLSGVTDYYNTLSPMFRHGSSVYWDRVMNEKERSVVVKHCNIIETSFWEAHPDILDKAQWL